MSISSHHAIILYGAVALISGSGPMPISVFSATEERYDGVAVLTTTNIQFYPFSDDYSTLGAVVDLTAATRGTMGIPNHVEILLPNEAILNCITSALQATPEHLVNLRDATTMILANSILTYFVTSCTATFTDPTHPPSWEAIAALWRSEGHVARKHLREKLQADEAQYANFATAIGSAVRELQEGAASRAMIDTLQAELDQVRAELQENQKLLASVQASAASATTQDTAARAAVTQLQRDLNSTQSQSASQQQQLAEQLAALQYSLAAGAPPASGPGEAPLNSAAILALARALNNNRTAAEATEFTIDIRTWGPLRARYGSWPDVKDRLYRALHIVPNAVKHGVLEQAFTSFDAWYDIVFARWEAIEDLATAANLDIVEALNENLRRLIIASKQQQGLHLKADVARTNVAADPFDIALQRSLETTYKTTFVPNRGMPQRKRQPLPARRWRQQQAWGKRQRRSRHRRRHGRPVKRDAERADDASKPTTKSTQPAGVGVDRRRGTRRRRVHGKHVEQHNVDADAQPVGSAKPLLRRIQPSTKRNELHSVRALPVSDPVDKTHVRTLSHQHIPQDGMVVQSVGSVRLRIPIHRCPLPIDAGSTANASRCGKYQRDSAPSYWDCPKVSMENREPLERHQQAHIRQRTPKHTHRSHPLLWLRNKNKPAEPIPAGFVCGHPRKMDGGVIFIPATTPAYGGEGATAISDQHRSHDRCPSPIRLSRAQYKARRDRASVSSAADRRPTDDSNPFAGKAWPRVQTAARTDNSICQRPGSDGTALGHRSSDLDALVANDWAATLVEQQLPPSFHSIVCRRAHARLPTTAAERAAPLHVSRVECMDMEGVILQMKPERQSRIQEIWDLVGRCPHKFRKTPQTPGISTDDARKLLEAIIVEKQDGNCSHAVYGSAFSVVEEKHGVLRRPFILWPRQINEWLDEQGYRANVDLDTTPFSHVLQEWGGITDLTTSFFQVEIPPAWRPLFSFRAADGSCYQMRVLPMGLSASPEIMHAITSTVAGHPTFARKPQENVGVNVWIDNIQVSGPKRHVEHALERVKQAATRFRITLNRDETQVSQDYIFAGVRFNHARHEVSVGRKAHQKLLDESLEDLTLEKLERLMGKLWFATRVLSLPVHYYWWCLKATRRLFSRWSRGMLEGDQPLKLPPSADRQLRVWYAAAAANTPRTITALPHTSQQCDVFTDATLDGWGVVCVDQMTKRAVIAGSRLGREGQQDQRGGNPCGGLCVRGFPGVY